MIKFERTLHTDGSGLWSKYITAVTTTRLVFRRVGSKDFGELQVYFNTKTWSTRKHGLIYTDKLWLAELHAEFAKLNVNVEDLDYSEQGMQGDNYVSLDAGGKFINDFEKLVKVVI